MVRTAIGSDDVGLLGVYQADVEAKSTEIDLSNSLSCLS
jgi:hypothetical protein